MVTAQEWLDEMYPEEARKKIRELDISNNYLEDKLELKGFDNLERLDCSNNQFTNIDLVNLPKLNYFKALNCRITSLTINGCPEISFFHIRNNYLTDLKFLENLNPEKLNFLSVHGNNLPRQDLSVFSKFVNLESLHLGTNDYKRTMQGIYNRFYGSLQPLKNLTNLKYLDITSTDIDSGLEYLPESFKKITWGRIKYRYDAKCLRIEQEIKESANMEGITEKLQEIEEGEPEWANGWYRISPWREAREKNVMQGQKSVKSGSATGLYKKLIGFDLQTDNIEYDKRLRNIEKMGRKWSLDENSEGDSEIKCKECSDTVTSIDSYTKSIWCHACNSRHFREEFKNWTSGNPSIDKFIQQSQLRAINQYEVLEWIPYEQFTDIEFLAQGGFGKVYKAKWTDGIIDCWSKENNGWKRESSWDRGSIKRGNDWVVLKFLNGSKNVINNFLQEVAYHKLVGGGCVVRCFGISRDPNTEDYIMIMDYIPLGDLRQHLKTNFNNLTIREKVRRLFWIVNGLKNIHEYGLIHKDLHTGNILSDGYGFYITDLGLCKPVNETNKGKIFGALPYIAPEVLRGDKYTQASDIYSFGMVAYEVLTGLPPYYNLVHDQRLGQQICLGLRLDLDKVVAPQLLKDLIKSCWDADPLRRPTFSELWILLGNWDKEGTEFFWQIQKTEEINKTSLPTSLNYQIHPRTFYTSRLLDFPNLPRPRNNSSQEWQTSVSLELQIEAIEAEIKLFKESLNNEQAQLVEDFVQAYIKKETKDEKARNEVKSLDKKLKEKGFGKENIKKVVEHCKKLVELEKQVKEKALKLEVTEQSSWPFKS